MGGRAESSAGGGAGGGGGAEGGGEGAPGAAAYPGTPLAVALWLVEVDGGRPPPARRWGCAEERGLALWAPPSPALLDSSPAPRALPFVGVRCGGRPYALLGGTGGALTPLPAGARWLSPRPPGAPTLAAPPLLWAEGEAGALAPARLWVEGGVARLEGGAAPPWYLLGGEEWARRAWGGGGDLSPLDALWRAARRAGGLALAAGVRAPPSAGWWRLPARLYEPPEALEALPCGRCPLSLRAPPEGAGGALYIPPSPPLTRVSRAEGWGARPLPAPARVTGARGLYERLARREGDALVVTTRLLLAGGLVSPAERGAWEAFAAEVARWEDGEIAEVD